MKETFSQFEKSVVREVGGVTKNFEKRVEKYRKSVFERFPFIIISMSTFGFVAVLYAFEKLIDRVTFLAENPLIILLIGLVSLAVTGTLYKKLS